MIDSKPFPQYVTHSSAQSRTLGAQLDRMMGGKTPAELISNPEIFPKLMKGLWHNLPCLTDESVLLCLPFYFNINGPNSAYTADSPDLPADWQLNEDYAYRLLMMISCHAESFHVLQNLDQNERRMLTDLFKIFEEETEQSFEPVLKLVNESLT